MVQLQQQSGTANNAILAVNSATLVQGSLGSLATVLLAASLTFTPIPQVHTAIAIERPGTVGQFGNPFSHSFGEDTTDFEGSIARFYATLLAAQEPLGRDFEQALYKNLSDLYVRS
jgi:hypothetical protein